MNTLVTMYLKVTDSPSGLRERWMRVWVRIQVCQARYKNKEGQLSEQTCWISGQGGDCHGVCICPLASSPFPICSSLLPSLLVAVLLAWERKTEARFLDFADWGTPRFVGSFGHIICEVAFLCSEWLLVLIIDVCMERHFICVLAERFLCILYDFPMFFASFLNYIVWFFCFVLFFWWVWETLKPLLTLCYFDLFL